MLDAFSAETLKLTRHKATWFLVWLFPILFGVLLLIGIVVAMLGFDQRPDQQSLGEWIEDTAVIWFVPGNVVGRYLIAAFVAVVFAGEYGWNTWKLIVPHRARTSLIAAKYTTVLTLFAISFLATALITILGTWVEDLVAGDPVPAGVTAGALLDYHSKAALAAAAPALLTIGYASLAAVLTRSTIAALVIAIVATTMEQLIYNFGPMLSVRFPTVIHALYPVLPGYHLANLTEWIRDGVALRQDFPAGHWVELAWGTSLAAMLAWIGGVTALTFLSFRRQDLN